MPSKVALSLPNPKTSPLVRGARYIALGFGILYGFKRVDILKRKEVCIQLHDDIIRAKRDARLAQEKEIAMKCEMNSLAKEVGITKRI